MSRHRKGELGAVPFRSGRFFYIDRKWYFSCREGKEKGPYDNKKKAEQALLTYIAQMAQRTASQSDEAASHSYRPTYSP